jgi:hypothetical protein
VHVALAHDEVDRGRREEGERDRHRRPSPDGAIDDVEAGDDDRHERAPREERHVLLGGAGVHCALGLTSVCQHVLGLLLCRFHFTAPD